MNYVWLSFSADPSLVERGHHIIDNKNKKNIIHIHGTNGYTDDMNANNASRRARSNHDFYHGDREYRRHPGLQACMPPSLNGLKIL